MRLAHWSLVLATAAPLALCAQGAPMRAPQGAPMRAPQGAPTTRAPQAARAPLTHAARQGDTLTVHYAGSLAGAQGVLLERQATSGWRVVGDTVRLPMSIAELRTRLGARAEYLARLYDAENDRLLWLRVQSDPVAATLAALLDADIGAALGRRLVDPRADFTARYRVRVLGGASRTADVAMPRGDERLPAAVAPAVSHVPAALTVRWRRPAGSDALAWHVEGRNSSDTTWRRLSLRPIASPDRGDSLSTVIALVREGIVWQIAVRPIGAGGRAGALSPVTRYEAFDRTAPQGVLDPRGAVDSMNVATLRWSAASEPDAAGYHVYRARDGKAKGTRLTAAPIPVERLTWSDTTLRESGAYVYRLSVVDSAGNESAPGNGAPLNVPDRTAPELRGTLIARTLGDSAVRLTWARARAGDLREYVISRQRGDKSAGDSWARLSKTLYRDSSFTDRGVTGSGLRGARVLTYRVVALDSTGNTSATLEATVTLPDLVAPAAAAWVLADRAPGRAVITWGVSPSADVARYELRRATAAGDSLVATIPAGTRSAYDDFDAGAVSRRYSIIARDTAGNASPSRTATLAPDLGPPLRAPANVIAVASERSVVLRWDPVTGAQAYRIERADRLNGRFATVGTVPATGTRATANGPIAATRSAANGSTAGTITSLSFTDPTGRVGHWYRVTAIDAAQRAGASSPNVEAARR